LTSLLRRLGTSVIAFGFDPRATLRSLRFIFGYFHDLYRWWRSAPRAGQQPFELRLLPTLAEKYAASGTAKGHYFHQDLWAARLIFEQAPARHVDVGSRIDGFVAHLLSFREVEVLDIRRLESRTRGLHFRQADLMSDRPPAIAPADSVSCLHAIEHFGLGRYGDPITPEGWRIGLRNLAALVQPGGRLYLGAPIGRPAIEFNAQRIFHPRYLVDEAALHGLKLTGFAYVDDAGDFHPAAADAPMEAPMEALTGLEQLDYGCGLFLFEKSASAKVAA